MKLIFQFLLILKITFGFPLAWGCPSSAQFGVRCQKALNDPSLMEFDSAYILQKTFLRANGHARCVYIPHGLPARSVYKPIPLYFPKHKALVPYTINPQAIFDRSQFLLDLIWGFQLETRNSEGNPIQDGGQGPESQKDILCLAPIPHLSLIWDIEKKLMVHVETWSDGLTSVGFDDVYKAMGQLTATGWLVQKVKGMKSQPIPLTPIATATQCSFTFNDLTVL